MGKGAGGKGADRFLSKQFYLHLNGGFQNENAPGVCHRRLERGPRGGHGAGCPLINPYVGCPHACKYCYARFMKRFTGHTEEWGNFIDIKRCDKTISVPHG